MVVDSVGNGEASCLGQIRIELLGARIQSSHDALQVGKFLHQLGGEISLGQTRRFVDHSRTNCHARLPQDFA